MTCRCASTAEHTARALAAERSSRDAAVARMPPTPDAARFEIEDSEQVGPHLVLRVKYPNCAACAYEGMKVMVFLNQTTGDALKWRRIDPHFRGTDRPAYDLLAGQKQAPSPNARFPASTDGWTDAITYARGKSR